MGRRACTALTCGLLVVLVATTPALASASPSHHDDLSIQLVAAPTTVVGGSDVAFTATVTHAGKHEADEVVVTDTLPPGATFVPEGSDPSCTQDRPGTPVMCALGDVPTQASVDVVIQATMPCVSDRLVDSAEVAADDDTLSKASASTTVTVLTPCSAITQQVENGGTVTTDPDRTGTDPSLGVFETASIVIPEGVSGDVSISLIAGESLDPCPGFTSLVATTDQPAATGEDRLVLVFTFAACSIPPGTNIADTMILKSADGQTYVAVPPCLSYHMPDPCLQRAWVLRRGDFRYRVLWSGLGDPSWRPG